MASILESVEWGKQALEFLKLIELIDNDKPAIIYRARGDVRIKSSIRAIGMRVV